MELSVVLHEEDGYRLHRVDRIFIDTVVCLSSGSAEIGSVLNMCLAFSYVHKHA